jgi:DNA-binding MarR family transcriptional regulator
VPASSKPRLTRKGERPAELPQDDPLPRRVVVGLSKVGLALRAQAWREAGARGLTPTQGQVLAVLKGRRGEPCRLQQLADALGVSAATASDAVQALERKRLVARERSREDARALAVALTARGREEARLASNWSDFLAETVSGLSSGEQAALLRMLTRMILGLQQRRLVPVAAMCVTCRFFRPNQHPGSARPHHCAFVDAPFGDAALRLECPEHEPATAKAQASAVTAWLVA